MFEPLGEDLGIYNFAAVPKIFYPHTPFNILGPLRYTANRVSPLYGGQRRFASPDTKQPAMAITQRSLLDLQPLGYCQALNCVRRS